jgi:PKD repeat protein
MRLAVALAGLAMLPSAAQAAEPCRVQPGACQPERPYVTFKLPWDSPQAGHVIELVATASGSGVSLDWDLDGDGAYDDAAGATVHATFAAGQRSVAVKATDQYGRTAIEQRGFYVTTVNVMPTVTIDTGKGTFATGQAVTVKATGLDIDGATPRVELDLDDDGTYEHVSTAGEASGSITFATAGAHIVRANVIDDDGAVARATATLGVYTTPGVTIQARPPEHWWSPVIAGEPAEILATPAGYAHYDYDLDGDGTYETAAAATFTHTFTEGDHVIGVRATDVTGKVATSRASVHVNADPSTALSPLMPLHPPIAYTGVPVRLSARYDPYHDPTFDWDADDDGAFDDGSTAVMDVSHRAGISFTYATPGTYTVRVRETTTDGSSQIASRTIQVVDPPVVPPAFGFLHTWPIVVTDELAEFELDVDEEADVLTFDLDGDGAFDDFAGRFVYGWEYMFAHSATIAIKATGPDGGVAIRTADVNVLAGNLGPGVDLTPHRRELWDGRPLLFSSDPDDPILIKQQISALDRDFCCDFAWDLDNDGDYDDGSDQLYLVQPPPGERVIGARVRDGTGAVATVQRTFPIASDPPSAYIHAYGSTVEAFASDREGYAMTYAWDLDGDGAFDDATGKTATALAGEHLVGVTATDPGGDIGVRYEWVTPTFQPVPARPSPSPRPAFVLKTHVPPLRLGALRSRGLSLTVSCSVDCVASVTVRVSRATAKRLHLPTTVGHARAKAGVLRVTLTAKAVRALRRAKLVQVTLTTTATATDGRRAVDATSVTIRR